MTTLLQVRYWRDIPAMVSSGRGRGAVRAALPERFEQAIDRCAMKVGAKDEDAYLAEWRTETETLGADAPPPGDAVAARAAELDAIYDSDRLKTLIANDGWSEATG